MAEDELMFRFQHLEVWQRSVDLTLPLGVIAEKLAERHMYRHSEQLRSAALSISNNIAEGSGSTSTSEFRSFLNYARRSVYECASMLLTFDRQQLVPQDLNRPLRVELNQISRMITGLSKSLN